MLSFTPPLDGRYVSSPERSSMDPGASFEALQIETGFEAQKELIQAFAGVRQCPELILNERYVAGYENLESFFRGGCV